MRESFTKIFENDTIDFFYDNYFRKEVLHEDWTDEQISLSVNADDIEDCIEKMRKTLYDHFGVEEKKK